MKKDTIKTKQKILEALGDEPIKDITDAIDFLEFKDGLEVNEISWKWEVTSQNGEVFHFFSDDELIEWAREEKDKIEGL